VPILIIDDDSRVVETLADMLEHVGFRICKACGASKGWSELSRSNWT
jgi:DNA-binding response OmpR family regulator